MADGAPAAASFARPESVGRATLANRAFRAVVDESLVVVVLAAFVALNAILIPEAMAGDGWLAFVAGRFVAHHGVPHHDAFAALTAGRAWVDQQWLGQLVLYGLDTVGGLRAVVAVNFVVVSSAFAVAAAAARRRGGEAPTVAVVALIASLPFLVTSLNVRTQSIAYVPFVLLVLALRRPGRWSAFRVAAILAVLVVWANVHGSVLLAAALVALRGVFLLRDRQGMRSHRWRGVALIAGPWACVFVSPYGPHLASYYARTAFNPAFSKYLSQWAPTTFSPISAPLLALVFASIWVLGRRSWTYTAYERCLIVVADIIALAAVRNWPFALLILLPLLPVGFDAALRSRPARQAPVTGGVIAMIATVAVGAIAAHEVAKPASALARNYPPGAGLAAVRAADKNQGRIYASIEFADWLLWSHPNLTGHIVFDVRYELLTGSEVKRMVLFSNGTGLADPLGHPSIFVLDPNSDNQAIDGLRPRVRPIYETDRAFVAVTRESR